MSNIHGDPFRSLKWRDFSRDTQLMGPPSINSGKCRDFWKVTILLEDTSPFLTASHDYGRKCITKVLKKKHHSNGPNETLESLSCRNVPLGASRQLLRQLWNFPALQWYGQGRVVRRVVVVLPKLRCNKVGGLGAQPEFLVDTIWGFLIRTHLCFWCFWFKQKQKIFI